MHYRTFPPFQVDAHQASQAKIYMSKYANILKEVQWGGDLKIGVRQIRGLFGLGRTTMLHAKVCERWPGFANNVDLHAQLLYPCYRSAYFAHCILPCSLAPLPFQVVVGSEIRVSDKAALDGRLGTCVWFDKDLVMRDVPATKELVVEIWAADASKWEEQV